MSLGRHGLCLRKAHAGDPSHLSLRAMRSGLVHGLIGRYTDKIGNEDWDRVAFGHWRGEEMGEY